MNTKAFSLLCCFILAATFGYGQYPRGLDSGVDSLYEVMLQKATQTEQLYRSSGSAASLKKYCPVPRSQDYGTCAAFACAYSARTILEAQYQQWTDKTLITQNAFSPGFIYKITEPNKYRPNAQGRRCWGAATAEILGSMKKHGVPKFNDFPSECVSSYPSQSTYNKAAKFKIGGYARLFGSNGGAKQKVQTVRKSIAEGNPVVVSMICPSSFDRAKGVWRPTESPGDPTWGRQHGRHAICVIGYDDDKYGGAFEILNSWGTRWGNQGYIWIKYTDFARFIYQAIEVFPLTPPPPPTPVEVALKGSIEFVQIDGTKMDVARQGNTYRFKEPYVSGTRFRIYINNNEPAYVYAFGSDASEEIFPVFPFEPSTSPALIYRQNQVAIPSEEKHIRLDATTGKDYLCMIYSAKPLNIERIKKRVKNGSGSFQSKVRAALKGKGMKTKEVAFQNNKIAFSAKSKEKSVVTLFMEIEHQ